VNFETIEKKVLNGGRLNADEGRFLLSEDCDLLALGDLAQRRRFQLNPGNRVTYVIDSNPNYTNICDTDCLFCAFYRRPGDKDAYSLTVDQVMEKIQKAVDQGATTILLQGGHNRALPLSYYEELVRTMRKRFPSVAPHFFTASEVQTMAQVSGKTIEGVLKALWDAGQRSLPGGGAEVLSERVRKKLAHKKGGPEKWLEVHRAAHKLGYKSTATMMYGHVETVDDILEHWEHIRSLQDETKGFTAFIPWSFKPHNTVLERRHPDRTGPVPYLRMLAASRLYLDNFPHIQASWFSEGKKTGQVSLHFGADDFGGTLIDENVHAATEFINKATAEEVVSIIHEAGFDAAQRTTLYEVLKTHGRN
jgi:cyclic dehypoxanthinyl futalosine synthase